MRTTTPNRLLTALTDAAYGIHASCSTYGSERPWYLTHNEWGGVDTGLRGGRYVRTSADYPDDPDESADLHLFDERGLHAGRLSFSIESIAVAGAAARAAIAAWVGDQ